jgi:hypothetical protein
VLLATVLLGWALLPVTPARAGKLPATGQTTAYPADKNDGISGPVAVPDDGTLQRGATLRYKVLKNGTIKDLNTGLIWEMKCSACGGLHDVDNTYVWSGNGTQETIWDWLEDINAEGGTGYAGHNDWRIPNVRELQSIVDYQGSLPAIDPIFGPTARSGYWSSTTVAGDSSLAWPVGFGDGGGGLVMPFDKSRGLFVRAVRGGPK